MKIYRPGPLPPEKVPLVGFPQLYGLTGDGFGCTRATIGSIDVAGHVWAMDGVDDQTERDIRDFDDYSAEYAARWSKRGRPEVTCQWCALDERKHLIRTANRRN